MIVVVMRLWCVDGAYRSGSFGGSGGCGSGGSVGGSGGCGSGSDGVNSKEYSYFCIILSLNVQSFIVIY